MSWENYKNRLVDFFNTLISKPKIGGLLISDYFIQYVLKENHKSYQAAFVKLPPGTLENGVIKNKKAFLDSLGVLYGKIVVDPGQKLKIAVGIPQTLVYSQVFDIPNVGRVHLAESAALNLQMISPLPQGEAYMSWQLIEENEDKYILLGSFIAKKYIDEYRSLLIQAGFYPVSFEPPSLALNRLIRNLTKPTAKLTLNVYVSNDGINLFLVKGKYLRFDYFKSWQTLRMEHSLGGKFDFVKAAQGELIKVLSYLNTKFKEPIETVNLIAPGIETQVYDGLYQATGIKPRIIKEKFAVFDPTWYAAVGLALRRIFGRSEAAEINLNSESVTEVLFKDQLIEFIVLWRNILGITLGSFVLVYAASSYLIKDQNNNLKNQIGFLNNNVQIQELTELRDKVTEFNSLVESLNKIKTGRYDALARFNAVLAAADSFNISVVSLSTVSNGPAVKFSGRLTATMT